MLYRDNKIFVAETRDYGRGENFGIVGHSNGNLVCYMCPEYLKGKCCHVKLMELEENQEHPAVLKFLSLRHKHEVFSGQLCSFLSL